MKSFRNVQNYHFTPKTRLNGLKMIGKLSSAKINLQNLTHIFHFRGIPDGPKSFFFRKRVRLKSNSVDISQYFLT